MEDKLVINNAVLKATLGDITRESVDAIVNAANSGLMGGGGVDGAIHRAGGPAIKEECRKIVQCIGRLPAGQAVITGGGRLLAKYVIHTVGPVWNGGNSGEPDMLASCYRSCLELASSKGIRSISFPAISTGIYGYPSDLAAVVAIHSVSIFIKNQKSSIEDIHFVLFDRGSYETYLKEMSRFHITE